VKLAARRISDIAGPEGSLAFRVIAAPAGDHHRWYVAAVLCAAHTVAMIDRFVMVLVTEPVRHAMALSDAQLGLLQGTGFAILYCLFAVPLGIIADAVNRRNLIMAGLAIWSCATFAAAFAPTFGTLFASRILVGMGEACLIPSAMSLLGAYFAPSNLARGTAVFGLGANFGYGLAFLGGGALLAALEAGGGLALPALGVLEPWRGLFACAGVAAFPVLLLLIGLREPPRQHLVDLGWRPRLAHLGQAFAFLRSNLPGYASFLVVASLTSLTGYALSSWSASLLVRLQHIGTAEAGKLIGLVGILAGPAGTLIGGIALDRLRDRGVTGAPLVVMAGGAAFALITAAGVIGAPSLGLAVTSLSLFTFGSMFVLPSVYVGIQMLTPDRHRGVAAAFNMMTYTLCGLGLGPPLVGIISDLLPGGGRSLGAAVVIVEAAMAVVIVPVALRARSAFHAKMLLVIEEE
jgi:MFS family permease